MTNDAGGSVVTNMSKIQSESNSQHVAILYVHALSCDQYVKDTIWKQFTTDERKGTKPCALWPICQRYNLKAIHNKSLNFTLGIYVVTNMSKIQSESNSQQATRRVVLATCCDQYVKDTIWKQFTTYPRQLFRVYVLWPICQRYNLKAIHNWWTEGNSTLWLWPICQRYNLKAIHN